MSSNSFDMSFNLRDRNIHDRNLHDKESNINDVPLYKYLDIDSTYRNRNNYPLSSNFVIPITYSGRDSNSSTAIDPIIDSSPYTESIFPSGSNQVQSVVSPTQIQLGVGETTIDNFYVNSFLEINGEFRKILSYVGATKTATIDSAFTLVVGGNIYYTRKSIPFFVGTVAPLPAPTSTSFAISGGPSSITNSYVRFITGPNAGLTFRVLSYDILNSVITVLGEMPNVPVVGDSLELGSFSRDNASTLVYSGTVNNVGQNAYYEIELCWLSLPNKLLGVGYGGGIDRYPYLYVNLYNEGRRLYNQPMFSNNPNSTLALFKVPINEYFGDTSFVTLKDSKTRQIVRFETNQDIRFTVSLPDGTVLEYAEKDSFSPLSPNPFLQINALFSVRKIT
jgi:hypothetical protein